MSQTKEVNFSAIATALDSTDVRVGLNRVQLPVGTELRCVLPVDALQEPPHDPPDGWVTEGVRAWWSSLTTQLLTGDFGAVRLVVDQPGLLRRRRVLPADVAKLLHCVEVEAGVPSSSSTFTLAWGVTDEAAGVTCRGAAFSASDHVGLCLCAPPHELARLQAWWAIQDGLIR